MNVQIASKLKIILAAVLLFLISMALEVNLVIPLLLLVITAYLKLLYGNFRLKPYNLLNLTLLFVVILFISYFIIRQKWFLLSIPFSAVPMIATMLFAEPVISLLLTFATSATIATVGGGNIYLGILFFISGLLGSLLVLNARRRITVIRAGFIVGIAQALSLFFIDNFVFRGGSSRYPIIFFNGILCSIIAVGVLPVFEYLFKTVTNISLLELADFNQPLLQRLIMEAPGTYHHSLIVGNLSEAACQAVGAHALLARIGAYYHDIGKLQKPEYFSENQNLSDSKHDVLSPTMSKMVIMNHVKDGLELARRNKLNPALLDFIAQHHGNSLVFYFYRRALEKMEEDQEIKEAPFRYPGPKPNTKETAIVLLADSVEAAIRALKDPTPAAVEEAVHKVINNKFIDGQLDECELALKDIEKVAKVFIRILSGMYHGRISYPDYEKLENSHKRPAKENSDHPADNVKAKKSNP